MRLSFIPNVPLLSKYAQVPVKDRYYAKSLNHKGLPGIEDNLALTPVDAKVRAAARKSYCLVNNTLTTYESVCVLLKSARPAHTSSI